MPFNENPSALQAATTDLSQYQTTPEDELVKELAQRASGAPGLVAGMAGHLASQVPAGWQGINELMLGHGPDAAANAVNATSENASQYLTPPLANENTGKLAQSISAATKPITDKYRSAEDLALKYTGPGVMTAAATAAQMTNPDFTWMKELGGGAAAFGTLLPKAITEKVLPEAVKHADALRAQRVPTDEIWHETAEQHGLPLIYDPINKGWRAEISDNQFQFKPKFKNGIRDVERAMPSYTPTIGDVFSHPELEKIPDLWNHISKIKVMGVAGGGMAGDYLSPNPAKEFPGRLRIHEGLADPDQQLTVASHEMQHAVDEIGGGIGGTNPRSAGSKEDYHKNISEIVARGTQWRRHMTPAERAKYPFENDTDTPLAAGLNNPSSSQEPTIKEAHITFPALEAFDNKLQERSNYGYFNALADQLHSGPPKEVTELDLASMKRIRKQLQDAYADLDRKKSLRR